MNDVRRDSTEERSNIVEFKIAVAYIKLQREQAFHNGFIFKNGYMK